MGTGGIFLPDWIGAGCGMWQPAVLAHGRTIDVVFANQTFVRIQIESFAGLVFAPYALAFGVVGVLHLANTVEFDVNEALVRIVFESAGVREWITLLFFAEGAIGVVIKRTFVSIDLDLPHLDNFLSTITCAPGFCLHSL
jgi:hypothetical protein